MKRKFLILSFVMIMLAGLQPSEAFAKQKSKRTTKSQTTTTKNIEVEKNWEGYPDPTGHTYRLSMEGYTWTLDFTSPYNLIVTTSYKKDKAVESWGWNQEGGVIYSVGGSCFYLSEDGKALKDRDSELIFYIIK